MSKAQAIVVEDGDWQIAAEKVVQQLADFGQIDLLFLFSSYGYDSDLPALVKEIYEKTGVTTLLGCTGQGVIGRNRELEQEGGLTALALALPGIKLQPTHITQDVLAAPGFSIAETTRTSADKPNAWLLLCDPFTFDTADLVDRFTSEFSGVPLVGGMASGDVGVRQTYLFHNGEVLDAGALIIAVGGDYTVQPVVSQGATPIGEAWMVTAAERNIITAISGRPAYQVLIDTIRGLTPQMQQKVSRNLLVGLAVDEYKADFNRGDFIIRNLMAIDPQSGAIAISDIPRIGQTIQFQLRDGEAASEDLNALLGSYKEKQQKLNEAAPVAGLVFSCNGRGRGLFSQPDHDAQTITEQLNGIPLAGFFCNGEIGPIGPRNFLHGFTASLGFFVKVNK